MDWIAKTAEQGAVLLVLVSPCYRAVPFGPCSVSPCYRAVAPGVGFPSKCGYSTHKRKCRLCAITIVTDQAYGIGVLLHPLVSFSNTAEHHCTAPQPPHCTAAMRPTAAALVATAVVVLAVLLCAISGADGRRQRPAPHPPPPPTEPLPPSLPPQPSLPIYVPVTVPVVHNFWSVPRFVLYLSSSILSALWTLSLSLSLSVSGLSLLSLSLSLSLSETTSLSRNDLSLSLNDLSRNDLSLSLFLSFFLFLPRRSLSHRRALL